MERSSGIRSARGTLADARAAWDYLITEQNQNDSDIVIYGRSLGGAVAIALASRTNPLAVVVESTFTSLASMASDIYPFLPTRLLLRHRYPSVQSIAEISSPVLVAHSDNDELIPPSHGQRLFQSAAAPKQFYRLNGSHNEAFIASGQPYDDAIAHFIDTARETQRN